MIISAPWGDTEFPDDMAPEQALGVLDNHYMQQQQSQLPPVAQTLSSMFGGMVGNAEESAPRLPSNASMVGMRGDDVRALVGQNQQQRAQVSQNAAQERMRKRIATEKAMEDEKDRAAQIKLEQQRMKNQRTVEKMRMEREENEKTVVGSSTTGYHRVGKTGAAEQVIPPQPNLTLIDTVDAQGRHVQQWVPEEQGASYPGYDRPLASGGGGAGTGENLQSVRQISLPGGAVGWLKFFRDGRNELTTLDGQPVNVPPDSQLVEDATGGLNLVTKQPGVPPTQVPNAIPSLRERLSALQSDKESTGFQASTPKPMEISIDLDRTEEDATEYLQDKLTKLGEKREPTDAEIEAETLRRARRRMNIESQLRGGTAAPAQAVGQSGAMGGPPVPGAIRGSYKGQPGWLSGDTFYPDNQ